MEKLVYIINYVKYYEIGGIYIIKIIKSTDTLYPKKLLEIKNHPKELYILGNEELLNKQSIAIVGSRQCSQYGYSQALEFARSLSENNICVISGLAKGIDTAAARGAKDEKGGTIAVLGSGFNYIYPEENMELYKDIIKENGLVVTEYSPDVAVDTSKFPRRNRIISALAMGVLVVEAKYRSGAIITAKYAWEQKKEVYCIPSNLGVRTGVGTNNLIKQGACLVTSYLDILQNYDVIQDVKIKDEYKEIYSLLSYSPININEISRKLDKNVSEINQALCMMELEALIKSLPGGEVIKV